MKRPALLVGSFILGALGLAAAAIVWLGGGNPFSRQVEAVINFHDGVSGLYVGAPVTFRGVPVGQVESIGLEFDIKALSARIPVNVHLSRDAVTYDDGSGSAPSIESLVQRGLRAKLVEQSFVTGQRSIELDILPSAPPVKLAGGGGRPEIPALANRLDALVDQLADLPVRELVAELRTTLRSTQSTLDGVRQAMTAMHSNLDLAGREASRIGSEARGTMTVARGAIAELRARSDSTLASITRLADTATGATDELRPDLKQAIAGARAAADAANVAMRHLAEITSADAPLRSDLDSAAADVAQAARALREWSELVDEQPNAVIFGRKNP